MKVTNNGYSTFTFRDKRGNITYLESKQSAEIDNALAEKLKKVKSYDFLAFEEKVEKEEPVKVEVKTEVKEEVKVSRETKKKKGKK